MTGNTEKLGEQIARHEDEHGEVTVFQRGHQRFLTFGNAVEQSCLNLAQPFQLEHVYTQAMMLALLLNKDATSALVLGLGGGSLVRALRHVRPRMRIDAVEYRPAVIEAAKAHFELPDQGQDQNRLNIHCDDAQNFIANDRQQYDLLMLDLYLAEGAHPLQSDPDFLSACKQRLNENGILMVNYWASEYQDNQVSRATLQSAFGQGLLYLQVQGGNTLAFAFADKLPRVNPKQLFADAQVLGNKLGIPLQNLARGFWRQNAQPLKIGRFAGG